MEKEKMKIKPIIFKGILIIIGILLGFYMSVLMVSAEENKTFEIEIVPSYYNEGYKLLTYSEDIEYDGISLEIKGRSRLLDSRIIDIKIFEITPEIFNKSLIQKRDYLRINQTKTLFETGIIETKDINESEFFISIMGMNENLLKYYNISGEIYYDEKYFKVNITENIESFKNDTDISLIGNYIWEGESKKGLWIGLGIFGVIIFISWKYKLIGNIGDLMEGYRRKEKYRRMKTW